MQIIKNARRKKQIAEFLDEDHRIMEEYYDALETSKSNAQLKKRMEKCIEKDPDFFDPYLVIAEVYEGEGKTKKAQELLTETYRRAVMKIADKDGNWPKSMPWGYLENRHIMRTLEQYAYFLWEEEDTSGALEIFRRLLTMNPNDNQGARHSILAIRMDLGPDWEEQFVVKDGPMAGAGLDAMKLGGWFEKNANKYPDEFDQFFKNQEKFE